MNQDKVRKVSDAEKNVWDEDETSPKKNKKERKLSYSERWDKARPSKKLVVGFVVGAIVVTMIVGFNWGGWVTTSTAQKMANDAITQRLSLICVGQFDQDPQKDHKLAELKDTRPYRRDDYVNDDEDD